MLRELADIIVRSHSVIFDHSWQLGEVPKDCRKVNVTPVFKKGNKEESGNCKPVSLTSISVKMMEQLFLETISRHRKDNKIIRSSQNGFTKMKSCLTTLTTTMK